MDQNNLVAMTQMMANTPIVKILPNAEMLGVMDKEPEPVLVPVQEERPPHRPGFYLGLRAGGNFDLSFIQNNGGYDGGVGRGISTEGALVVEFHPLRFLSLQTEVVFLYDTFKASKVIQRGQTEIRYTETFSSFSLMIPLLIKMPVTLDNLVLSSFVGGYYLLPLNGMNNGKVGYTMDPPFGFSLGFEWGIPLNSGMVSFGLRFDHDIGMGIVEEGPQYYRERIGLFAGYKFFLGKREESPPTPAQPAAPPAEGAAPAADAAG
jgi:hypothetical protein